MKRPKSRGTVPIGGMCRYVDPDAGFVIAHPMWDWCKTFAKSGRLKRGLPIPYDWDAFFDEQFCKATPKGCHDVPDAPIETAPNWKQLGVQFGKSLFKWIASGMAVVSWEKFKERHSQCTGDETRPRCPHFAQFRGLGITKCGACGCSSVKLFMATEKCPRGRW